MNRYLHTGSPTIQGSFGRLISVLPMRHVKGEGHDERVEMLFSCPSGGTLHLEFTRSDAVNAFEQLMAVALKLPLAPDVSDPER